MLERVVSNANSPLNIVVEYVGMIPPNGLHAMHVAGGDLVLARCGQLIDVLRGQLKKRTVVRVCMSSRVCV